jgi:FkbM family methyltransferase
VWRTARGAVLGALPPTARTRLRLVRKALVGPLPAPKAEAEQTRQSSQGGHGSQPTRQPAPSAASPVSTAPPAPRLRDVTLVVPATPGAPPRVAPREIRMTAPPAMFVPKVLQRSGLGGYERSSFPHFLAALEEAPPGAVLDVGANVGPYSLLARACGDRRVVAFEPTPDLAEIARVTAARNGLDYDVEEIALGDADGHATLHLSETSDSSNSLNPDFRPSSSSIDVPLERLDTWVGRTGTVPGLLKVDTETTEPAVLRGAVGTVTEHRPWVFCEVLYKRGEEELTEVVAPWGYTWYHLTGPGPLEPATRIVGDPEHEHFMWLFVPEPLGDEHWSRAAAWRAALDEAG